MRTPTGKLPSRPLRWGNRAKGRRGACHTAPGGQAGSHRHSEDCHAVRGKAGEFRSIPIGITLNLIIIKDFNLEVVLFSPWTACRSWLYPSSARFNPFSSSEEPDTGDGDIRVKCATDGYDTDPAQLRQVERGVDPVRGEIGEGKPDAVPIW